MIISDITTTNLIIFILFLIIKLMIFPFVFSNFEKKSKKDILKLKELPFNKALIIGLSIFLISIIFKCSEIEKDIIILITIPSIIFLDLILNKLIEYHFDKRIEAYNYLILKIRKTNVLTRYKEDKISLDKLISENFSLNLNKKSKICICSKYFFSYLKIKDCFLTPLILKEALKEYDKWVENDYKDKENFIFKLKKTKE